MIDVAYGGMVFRRPLFWLAAVAVGGAFYAERARARTVAYSQDSKELAGRLVGPARRTRQGWRTLFEFERVGRSERAQFWLPHEANPEDFVPGRELVVTGRLRLPRRPRDPGDDDEETRVRSAGAQWVLRAETVVLSTAMPPWRWWAHDLAQRARFAAEESFRKRLEPRQAALLAALVLGDAGSLTREESHAVRDSGGAHLLVVSGLKVGFVAGAAAWAGLWLGWRPGWRAAGAALAAGFYALMAGADPPSVRSWLMLAAGIAARSLDRPTTPSATLTLAAALIIAYEPTAALGTGFWMSFGGTAALLAVARQLERSAPRSWPRVGRATWTVMGINLAIAGALWPLYAATFRRASVIGPLANLALVPIAAYLIGAGGAIWFSDAWLPAAAPWAAKVADAGLTAFSAVCARAAAPSWAAVELRPWRTSEIAAYAFICGAGLMWPKRRFSAALACAGFGIFAAVRLFSRPPAVEVVFLARVPGNALVRFFGGPAWYVGPQKPDSSVHRAAVAIGAAPIERTIVGRIMTIRLGKTAISVGDHRGPRIQSGTGPFAIIARPRASALEVTTDGDFVHVEKIFPPRVRLGDYFPKRSESGVNADAKAGAQPAGGAWRQMFRRGQPPRRRRAAPVGTGDSTRG